MSRSVWRHPTACSPWTDGSDPNATAGRITPELLRGWLPESDFDVYMCGPRVFMSAVHAQLVELGVPDSAINYECFGPLQPV